MPLEQNALLSLTVRQFDTRAQMGAAAAADVARAIAAALQKKPRIRMAFAAAPSQNEFLAALTGNPAVDFSRVVAFHMDEYVGLAENAPQRFGNFLKARLFDRAPFAQVHYLNGNAPDIEAECARYAALLSEAPIDIICMGIGENGHIAFNDPHEANFHDAKTVKCVTLDQVCRMQQVHDGCFDGLENVPSRALTLSVPALLNADRHFCIIPAKAKACAVRRMLFDEIGPACPATALRLCADATVYLDAESAAELRLFPRA